MKPKKDYDPFKRFVIDNGLMEDYKRARNRAFWCYDPSEIQEIIAEFGPDVHHACQLMYSSEVRKYLRCRNKVYKFVCSGLGWFLTLTFRDDVLANTSEKTRKTYVERWIKSISDRYIANIDYGKINGREHYHAVVKSKEQPPNTWPYGFMCVEKVGKTDSSAKKISHYTTKLTAHAMKESTKGEKVVFPRLIVSRRVAI